MSLTGGEKCPQRLDIEFDAAENLVLDYLHDFKIPAQVRHIMAKHEPFNF